MRLLIVSFLIILQGCAALTRRNYIDLNDAKKDSVNSSDTLIYGDSQFEVKVLNRNSHINYLIVGPLLPFIPIGLFRHSIATADRFVVELLVFSKTKKNSDTIIDFSSMKIEEPLTEDKRVCGQQSARQVEDYKDYSHDFLNYIGLFSSGGKLYQINCVPTKNSRPTSGSVFLRISGLRALNQKTNQKFDIPNLVFSYRNTYQYELVSFQ